MKFQTNFQEIIPRTHDITSFRFSRPADLNYKPGQFMFFDPKTRRERIKQTLHFSSSPTEKEHIEFTKKFTDHEYSLALKSAKVGDWASIDAPYGQFTFEGEYTKIALLGGGIGITPFLSICKNATDKALKSKITLFYGCRTEKDLAFRRELERLAEKNKNLNLVLMVAEPTGQWKGESGIINVEKVKQHLPDYEETMFFTCGPPPMVEAMEKLVLNLGLSKENLKREYFTGYQ